MIKINKDNNLEPFMQHLLEQVIHNLVNGDLDTARSLYSKYFAVKSKTVFEALEKKKEKENGIVEVFCDKCGEKSTTTNSILHTGKWVCGHCDSKKYVKESINEATEYTLQGKYDGKWEDLTSSDSYKEIKDDYKAYRENEPQTQLKIRTKRIKDVKKAVKEAAELSPKLLKQFEERAEAERNAGAEIDIDTGLPSISITMSDGSDYFFQEHEAQAILDEVPDNIHPEDYILAIAQSW